MFSVGPRRRLIGDSKGRLQAYTNISRPENDPGEGSKHVA
jgi:hypothetical protein